ncbi:hypothetical protein J2M53_00835 [Arthrobacter sp. zg-ZUI100]|uniref:hypothetical protein n=1 Tax=Arthrobacter jiangjiafuii TaxID=2817475 RepID=UPI001AEF351F|nr:hypothetical protein [Arthrobacter jiangjiafuii]MBP3034799.1 hypothetical protein [Arthrobacter jiangjiafuii]
MSQVTAARPSLETARHASPGLARSDRFRRIATGITAQTLVTATVLGAVINSGNKAIMPGLSGGYTAGVGDHYVLSTLGLHWADSSRYAGDWFMEAAPQPHWFFDTLTYVGSATGTLALVYFLFWCFGLGAFALGVTFLSRKWAPQAPWFFSIATATVAALSPWAIVGTGSAMIPMAIPAVISANLVLLFIAAAITGREKWMLIAALMTAVVHVQQGAVVAVMLGALGAVQFFKTRTFPKATALTFLATVAIVVAGLMARPVASNRDDFIEICNNVIAYHCAAQYWAPGTVIIALAVIALALCTVLYLPKQDRLVWGTVVGLPIVGLLLGLTANVLMMPVFGELAQGLNVYRLGALVMPFAVMAMLLPVFKLGMHNLISAGAVLFLAWVYLLDNGWQIRQPLAVAFIGLFLLVGLAAVGIRSYRPQFSTLATRIGAAAIILVFLVNALSSGMITPRGVDATFIPDADIREWGEAVEEVVPPGESLLASPLASYVRGATYRGVIADCKNVPYGGEPWTQWQERINDLGGTAQCNPPQANYFNALSAREIDRAADKYGVTYLVVEEGQSARMPDLRKLGWSTVLEPVNSLQNVVMHKDADDAERDNADN